MNAADFAASIPGFYRSTAVDQLLALAWFLETYEQRATFQAAELRKCFKDAGADSPDLSVYLPRLTAKKPPQIVKDGGSFRLSAAQRRNLDARLGRTPTTVAVAKTLTDLPSQIPDISEREFLTETLNCYKVQAYRATVVMMWNLAYDHLVSWIFSNASRLSAMNTGIAIKYPKKQLLLVDREDADELKESELIEAARTAKVLDKNVAQILREKLGRRNMAAHPSRVSISQHSADDMITDLVTNVLLKLS